MKKTLTYTGDVLFATGVGFSLGSLICPFVVFAPITFQIIGVLSGVALLFMGLSLRSPGS